MAKAKSLEDLFVNLLKDMYYAEKQIVKTLPKLAKHAESAELRKAFEHHLKETEGQVQRLEQVFALCDLKPAGKTCAAIKGILEEGEEDIKEAWQVTMDLKKTGIDFARVADQLLQEGIDKFKKAYNETLQAITNKAPLASVR